MFAQSRCSAARRARGSPATSRHTAHRLRLAAQRSSAVRPLGNDFAEPRPAVIDLLTRRGPGAPGGPDAPSTSAASHTHQQRKIDILGIGQAIVDYAATVDDAMLEKFALPKGGRRVVTVAERGAVIEALSGAPSQISAGGSLANSLVAVARLAGAASLRGGAPLSVAMAGAVGSDALGQFFQQQLQTAGVAFATAPPADSQTGTVVVLTTPDAHRSFLSYFPPEPLAVDAALEAAVRSARLVVIEGYLWELPGAKEAICRIVRAAKAAGTLVGMSCGDAGVVGRHAADFREAIALGIDALFTNEGEALALAGQASSQECTAEDAARCLGALCRLVVVTDGSRGSYLVADGRLSVVPPCWLSTPPVDTNGAGDAYAGGLLFGLMRGGDVSAVGQLAARVASAVICKHGAQLAAEDAYAVVSGLPEASGIPAGRVAHRANALEGVNIGAPAADFDALALSFSA